MLSRNPSLHYVFAKMDLAEERGLGLKSLARSAEQMQLPRPRYDWDNPYLVLTLFRNAESVEAAVPSKVLDQLTKTERRGWRWLLSRTEGAQSSEYAKAQRVDERTARRHLNRLADLGLVLRMGAGPTLKYKPNQKDSDKMPE